MTAEELRKCLEHQVKSGLITKEQMETIIYRVALRKSGQISISEKRKELAGR